MSTASADIMQNDPRYAWIKQTRIIREWERIKKEILDHKWYESERAGCDIGWDRAMVDWMIKHGSTSKHSHSS